MRGLPPEGVLQSGATSQVMLFPAWSMWLRFLYRRDAEHGKRADKGLRVSPSRPRHKLPRVELALAQSCGRRAIAGQGARTNPFFPRLLRRPRPAPVSGLQGHPHRSQTSIQPWAGESVAQPQRARRRFIVLLWGSESPPPPGTRLVLPSAEIPREEVAIRRRDDPFVRRSFCL